MKFGIFPDCHLGVTRFRKMTGLENIYCYINNKAFIEALNIFKGISDLDGLIIPGDLFDSPNPSVQSINIASRLKDFKIPIYILGGNHDYSQRNVTVNCHPFDLIDSSNMNIVYDEPRIFNLDKCKITMIPYKSLNFESFEKVYDAKKQFESKECCNILVIHGIVNLKEEESDELFLLPKEVAQNYDLIIAGHVHLPQIIETKTVSIIVPGALMPSPQASSTSMEPSVYIYDTEGDIDVIPLNSPPKIFEYATNDINKTLETISNKLDKEDKRNDLYFIKYNGKTQDIDEYLYKKVSQNVLNLSIQTNETIDVSTNSNIVISDFWTYIKESYPDYYDEFKNLIIS